MNVTAADVLRAALAQFSSDSRLYALAIGDDGDPSTDDFMVEAFAASDLVSDIGWRDVIAVSYNAFIQGDAILGKVTRLEASLADGTRTTFRGFITAVSNLGTNGGLARYRLRISPWVWRLSQVRNIRVWQDCSVIGIIDDLLTSYQPLAIWRWSDETVAFMRMAATRSYRCQYRESDFDFLQRLLSEEGISWRLEESRDGQCMVLFADSRELCAVDEDATSAALGGVALHGAVSVQRNDSIQAVQVSRSVCASSTAVLSYDYKTKKAVHAVSPARLQQGSNLPSLESYDAPGAYAFASSAHALRYADLEMEGREARSEVWQGRSTVRTLRAGTRLIITNMPLARLSSSGFTLLTVTSVGVNNIPAPAQQALAELFGPIPELLEQALTNTLPENFDLLLAQAKKSGYANCFDAVAADVVWRPQSGVDGCSRARGTTFGTQSAIVIGADGQTSADGSDELYCDKFGRVRIRFHWQDNGDASCWVRVAQRSAGRGMGSQFLPRIGMEVLVQFIENDIDRPIIVGALYNGQGEGGSVPTPGGISACAAVADPFAAAHDHAVSGQGNLAGGNGPLWHGASPESAGHRNGAAQWGVRSKEFGGSGYSQLLFDDTDAQGRVQLKSSHACSELNLGHLIHTSDNYRGSLRGSGAELRTDAYGAVRAGAGLLISSYKIGHEATQRDAAGDNAAGIAMLKQAVTLGGTFSNIAMTHKTVALAGHLGAHKADGSIINEKVAPLKGMLSAMAGMVAGTSLDEAMADAAKKKTAPDTGTLPQVSDAIIAIAAKAGLGVVAGQSMQLSNGETVTLMSGQDTQFITGGQMRVHSGQAIGVLGGAMAAGERGVGLQMIAATGMIELQAQADALNVQARDDVNVMSVNAHVDWAAAKSIRLSTAGGANITIADGNITVQCPGKITIHAGKKSFSAPERTNYPLPHLPNAPPEKTDLEFRHFTEWGAPLAGLAFKATLSDGSIRKGQLDAQGYARLTDVPAGTTARIEYMRDSNELKSHVDTEIDPDVFVFFDLKVAPAGSGEGGKNGGKT